MLNLSNTNILKLSIREIYYITIINKYVRLMKNTPSIYTTILFLTKYLIEIKIEYII